MSTKTRCEAKNPATCRYHGTRLDESQWLPTYDEARARLDDLNNRTMSNHNSWRTTRELEQNRQAAILDLDASEEGMRQLNEQVEKARFEAGTPAFWAEEKVRVALAHRETKLAAAAIADFQGMKDEEYTFNTVERLFSGSTDAIVFERDGITVVSTVNETRGGVEFEEYDLTKTEDRDRLVAKRHELAAGEAARHRYGFADLRQDVLPSANAQIDIGEDNAVLRQDNVPYVRVEFNRDGTFNRAIAARDDSQFPLIMESPTPFREFVYRVVKGETKALPIAGFLGGNDSAQVIPPRRDYSQLAARLRQRSGQGSPPETGADILFDLHDAEN